MMYQCGRCGLTRASSQAMGLAMPQCQCPWEFTPPIPKPTREWVGLTDEEKADLFEGTAPYYNEADYADAIEAALRSKNNA